MSEPAPGPPSPPEKQRRSPISLALQAATLIFVGGLFGLLVYRLIASERGGAVVAAIKAGRKPKAPHFDLKVIWQRSDTWSPSYSSRATADRLSTDELKGMPVVMNFWASWCIPCKHEAPRLVAAASKYKTRVLFLGVDVQDFTSDARNFMRRYKINYPSVRDGTSSTFDRYGLTGVPETYYLNAQGRLVGHTIGEVSGDELEREILKLEGRS